MRLICRSSGHHPSHLCTSLYFCYSDRMRKCVVCFKFLRKYAWIICGASVNWSKSVWENVNAAVNSMWNSHWKLFNLTGFSFSIVLSSTIWRLTFVYVCINKTCVCDRISRDMCMYVAAHAWYINIMKHAVEHIGAEAFSVSFRNNSVYFVCFFFLLLQLNTLLCVCAVQFSSVRQFCPQFSQEILNMRYRNDSAIALYACVWPLSKSNTMAGKKPHTCYLELINVSKLLRFVMKFYELLEKRKLVDNGRKKNIIKLAPAPVETMIIIHISCGYHFNII